MSVCSIEACSKPIRRRSWCAKHYWRWTKYGDPLKLQRADNEFTLQQRLEHFGWDVVPSGCWEFRGSKDSCGYGRMSNGQGRNVSAHRVAYEIWVSPIPEGMQINHKCDNPACVNPDHLYAGTHVENMRDKATRNRGSRVFAKLTADDVLEIRRMGQHKIDSRVIAAQFQVSRSTVYTILRGETWRGV